MLEQKNFENNDIIQLARNDAKNPVVNENTLRNIPLPAVDDSYEYEIVKGIKNNRCYKNKSLKVKKI